MAEPKSNTQIAENNPSLVAQRGYWDARWNRGREPNGYQNRRSEAILALLQGLPLNRPRILDFGCGTGWFTKRLASLGEATGVDLSEDAIAWAKSQDSESTYIAANLYDVRFPTRYFDVVISQEVIAHVEDQPAYMRRISAMLKPGGYLILTTANKLVMDRWDHPPDPDEHIKRWLGLHDLRQMLKPHFRMLQSSSVIPLGDQGFLRVVNSHKLNAALSTVISQQRLDSLKEKARLGYTLIVLAQKI